MYQDGDLDAVVDLDSWVATSALEAPDAIAVATSSSRSVSDARRGGGLLTGDRRRVAEVGEQVRVADGEMIASPAATRRTALMMPSGGCP